jgi:hypothetical protein
MMRIGGVETWIGLSTVGLGRWRLCWLCRAELIFRGAITLCSTVGHAFTRASGDEDREAPRRGAEK